MHRRCRALLLILSGGREPLGVRLGGLTPPAQTDRVAIAPIEQQFPLVFLNVPAQLGARRPSDQRRRAQIDEGEWLPRGLGAQEGGGGRRVRGQLSRVLTECFIDRVRNDVAEPVLGVVEIIMQDTA